MCTVSICVFSLISDLCFSFCQSTIDINTHTNPFTQNESHRNIIVMIFTSTPLIVWHVSIFRAEFWLISPDVLHFSITFSHFLYICISHHKSPPIVILSLFWFSINETPPISSLISLNQSQSLDLFTSFVGII